MHTQARKEGDLLPPPDRVPQRPHIAGRDAGRKRHKLGDGQLGKRDVGGGGGLCKALM